LIKVKLSTGETYNYGYDENNNITSINNSLGTSLFYYDSLDRMVRYKDMYNKEIRYGYNAVGSVSIIIYSGGDSVNYFYDAANRLMKVIDWKKNTFTYQYDSSGRVTKLTYPTGIYCDYTYDATGRILSKYSKYKNNKILYGQSFSYHNDSVVELRWGSYPKDVGTENLANSYRADDAFLGNAVTKYVNDNNGDRTREIKGTDTIFYQYSIDQLLLSTTNKGINTIYGYDALGHRVKRKVGTDETRYILGLNGPLSLVMQTTNSSGTVRANYIYGLGLLEQIDSTGNELFYFFDSRHNTIAITDKRDSVKATYAYLLYGTLTNKTGNISQPFSFLGEFGVEQEKNSTYYIRARYYDALSGRFLSKDPLFGNGFEPQSLNRYVYSFNNPLEAYDITGLYGEKDFDGSGLSNSENSSSNFYNSLLNNLKPDMFRVADFFSGIAEIQLGLKEEALIKEFFKAKTIGDKLRLDGIRSSMEHNPIQALGSLLTVATYGLKAIDVINNPDDKDKLMKFYIKDTPGAIASIVPGGGLAFEAGFLVGEKVVIPTFKAGYQVGERFVEDTKAGQWVTEKLGNAIYNVFYKK